MVLAWSALLKSHQTLSGLDSDELSISAKSDSEKPRPRSRWIFILQLNCKDYLYSLHSYLLFQPMNNSTGSSVSVRTSALAEDLRLLIGTLKRRLREQGQREDLPPSQVAVLLRLEKDGPATVSSLARSEGMRPQSMSSAIATLEASGMVRGAPDPDDGRQTIMSLTEACRQRLRSGRAARQDWLSRAIAARLSPREQQELAAAVRLLKRLADD